MLTWYYSTQTPPNRCQGRPLRTQGPSPRAVKRPVGDQVRGDGQEVRRHKEGVGRLCRRNRYHLICNPTIHTHNRSTRIAALLSAALSIHYARYHGWMLLNNAFSFFGSGVQSFGSAGELDRFEGVDLSVGLVLYKSWKSAMYANGCDSPRCRLAVVFSPLIHPFPHLHWRYLGAWFQFAGWKSLRIEERK